MRPFQKLAEACFRPQRAGILDALSLPANVSFKVTVHRQVASMTVTMSTHPQVRGHFKDEPASSDPVSVFAFFSRLTQFAFPHCRAMAIAPHVSVGPTAYAISCRPASDAFPHTKNDNGSLPPSTRNDQATLP